MNTQERIDMLKEAQALISQAVELIKDATYDTNLAGRVEIYLISSLETAAYDDAKRTGNNPWLGNNPASIDSLIKDFEARDAARAAAIAGVAARAARSASVADPALVEKYEGDNEVMEMVCEGRGIQTCKTLRERENISLSEAKAVYDALRLKITPKEV